jgi:hypothetical protein
MKKSVPNHQAGNVFLYILIAVVLFAALSMVLMRGQDTGEQSVVSQTELSTTAQRLLTYVGQTSQAWVQMRSSGTDLDEIMLTQPSDGSFNSAPTIHKLFHPDGGGVLYNAMNEATFRASAAAPVGWHFALISNDWSASGAPALTMTYLNIKRSLCEELNRQITGSTTIPTTTAHYTDVFADGLSTLTEAACASCKSNSSICLNNGGVYAFYNVLEEQ